MRKSAPPRCRRPARIKQSAQAGSAEVGKENDRSAQCSGHHRQGPGHAGSLRERLQSGNGITCEAGESRGSDRIGRDKMAGRDGKPGSGAKSLSTAHSCYSVIGIKFDQKNASVSISRQCILDHVDCIGERGRCKVNFLDTLTDQS